MVSFSQSIVLTYHSVSVADASRKCAKLLKVLTEHPLYPFANMSRHSAAMSVS